MITIKDFMEAIDYRITEGSDFCWSCFGPNAYRLDSWNGEQDGYTISITFDTQTQEVYQAEAYDYANSRAYRLQNPDYVDAHDAEACSREIDARNAWDDVKFIELDVDTDFLAKARAIILGENYDTRVQIEVDFADEDLLRYMKLAHELDITFNQLIERALIEKIDELKTRQN